MLVFASICPHPPILVPEIGGPEVNKIKKTKKAMEDLAEILARKNPETLIFISPHGLIIPSRINICGVEKLKGNLGYFGAYEVEFDYKNDLELATFIDQQANKEGIQTLLYDTGGDSYELDHGIMVPLYFLRKKLKGKIKLVPIAYSLQDRNTHFRFGQIISSLITHNSLLNRIAIIASGDLSHRLIPSAPAGYSPLGQKFDKKLIELIKNNNIKGILEMDENFVEEAGECGYRSILILLGLLDSLKYKPNVLSYEGPFGVGYLVANFEIKLKSQK